MKVHQFYTPRLHTESLSTIEPEDAEKADNAKSRERLHQVGIEHLLLARRDPYHHPKGDGVDHGHQCHYQQRVVEHCGQTTRQGRGSIVFSDSHGCKFTIIARLY